MEQLSSAAVVSCRGPMRREKILAPEARLGVATPSSAGRTVFGVILAISFCHLLNDMMQILLPSIYPDLASELGLTFGQVGAITMVYQVTASLLQPLVGLQADRRPAPFALPGGTLFSLAGLVVISMARSYAMVLAGASLLGIASSIFHPESLRVARMAAGKRHGMAQALFQVGGNFGSAIGPIAAALVVVRFGQSSLALFGLLALLSFAVLWNVAIWYRNHGLARLEEDRKSLERITLPQSAAKRGIAILLVLIFSKYVYLTSLTTYFTFYLIRRFGVSIRGAQVHLSIFLAAVAVGTFLGGPLGDRYRAQICDLGVDPRRAAVHVAAAARQPFLDRSAECDHRHGARFGFPRDRGLWPGTGARQSRMISGPVLRFRFRHGRLAPPCWAASPIFMGFIPSIGSALFCRRSGC